MLTISVFVYVCVLACLVCGCMLACVWCVCVCVCTGDAVVYGADTATVIIEANDDANGIFSLESMEKPVEEGKTNNF